MEPQIDEREVARLAGLADLPLPEDRRAAVAAVLGSWLPGAQELSRLMSGREHAEITPITVLTHPDHEDAE